jgi:gliding motility-associated-like protein
MLKKFILSWVIVVGLMMQVQAKHIFGGDFTMTYQSNTQYQISLNLYIDEIGSMIEVYEKTISVYIFRKNDHRLMSTVSLQQIGLTPIVYDNAACAELRQLKTTEMRYTNIVTLNPDTYNHPEGYYIIWDRCCRNAANTNIINPGATGMVFKMEFPPLRVNGALFRNSSPDFTLPNGDYICINKPFKFDMSAQDSDRDELRYSMATPAAGYSSQTMPVGNGASRANYPNVVWAAGIGTNNQIPGPKPLSIDPKTGVLSVTANQTGLYVFAILVEEYRNGVRIGSVQREFQLPVVDCSKATPPVSAIFKDEKTTLPIQTLEICDGETVEVFAKEDANWAYQWQKDGDNLKGETASSLKLTQAGDYQVILSFAKTCANDTISQPIRVRRGSTPYARLTPTDTLAICEGDTGSLRATTSVGFSYEWQYNGAILANQTRNSIKVSQAGNYEVFVKQGGFNCPARDTVLVRFLAKPRAVMSLAKATFCPNDSVRLETTLQTGETVEWQRNKLTFDKNKRSLFVNQVGSYRIKVSNAHCVAFSDSARLQAFKVPDIKFDSLMAVCFSDSLSLPLAATPAGGSFVGLGVENKTLNVKTAGIGRHIIQYELPTPDGCVAFQKRTLVIKPIPLLTIPNNILLPRGESITLPLQADSTIYRFAWTPPQYLSSATTQRPESSAPQTTFYTARATSQNGCTSSIRTRVWVVDLLQPPSIFTPNADGINDTWIVRNIEKYPKNEVFIYNRWGTLMFYQKGYTQPWNGTFNGQLVTQGSYTYIIDPHSDEGDLKQVGSVIVQY